MPADFADYRRVLLWVNLRIAAEYAGEKIMPEDFADYRRVLLWVNLRISAGEKIVPADFADYRRVLFCDLISENLRDLREKELMPADFADYRRAFLFTFSCGRKNSARGFRGLSHRFFYFRFL